MYMFNLSGTTNNLTAMSPYLTGSAPQSPYDSYWPVYPSTQFTFGGLLPMQPIQPIQQVLTDCVIKSRTTTLAPITPLRDLHGTVGHRSDAAVFAREGRKSKEFNRHTADFDPRAPR